VLRRLVAGVAAVVSAAGLAVLAPAASASATPVSAVAAALAHHPAAAKPGGGPAALPARGSQVTSSPAARSAGLPSDVRQVCPIPKRGYAECMALARTNVHAHKGLYAPGSTPSGYGPSDFQSAYNLPSSTAGLGQTVAIVDAYNDPNIASDLATYRAQYGLPACTTASGCLQVLNQEGQPSPLPPNATSGTGNWDVEESLDVDMASATCPNCNIILVEANSAATTDLDASEKEAVTGLGAKYVSNSWASCEASGDTAEDQYFDYPGVAITAAGGDWGYDNYQRGCSAPDYPAASQYVTSVGGTRLTQDSSTSRGWTETTWSLDPQATGSGCSIEEPKPAWQHDSGCANRMTNDVSADADPATGAAVYDSFSGGGWEVIGGTSEASPIIAATYALAGVPAAGTNPASYPYADPSALNDVTSGSDYNQSCTPAYFCTAGPGYDGPTGLGTPDGVSAFRPAFYGTLTGTVTDATTGHPLAGAAVTVDSVTVKTNGSGQYSVTIPAGSYTVTAGDYGYATQRASGVQVSQDQTTTQNFTLSTAPEVTLSGTIRDGSGHGWPLYASVSIPGAPAPAYTNPVTGRYQLKVPEQASYTVTATAIGQGYQQAQQQVTIGTSNQTQNFRLRADHAACDATGYGLSYNGTTQDFDGTAAPSGWSVVNGAHSKNGWEFDDPGDVQNQTGSSGNFAIAYPAIHHAGENTELVSPVIDMSSDKSPILQFDTYLYEPILYEDFTINVDVSTDGGQTWSKAWSLPPSFYGNLGPVQETIPLRRAAGQPQVRIRFDYNTHGYAGAQGTLWEVDSVFLGNRRCQTIPGGLIEGTVTDANTGHPLNNATITSTSNPSQSATSGPVPSPGFYQMFTSAGSQSLAVNEPYYGAVTKTITVAANKVNRANAALPAARLSVSSAGLSATEQLGSHRQATGKLTITNTGTAAAAVKLDAVPGGFTPAGQPTARAAAPAAPGARLQLIKGHYSLLPGKSSPTGGHEAPAKTSPGTPAGETSWASGANYPTGIGDSAVATDPGTGWVYSAGGSTGSSTVAATYVYNPYARAWKRLPRMPLARTTAVAAFTDGKLYVIGGWKGVTKPQVQIYNPASRTWSPGAAEPIAEYSSSATVVDGKIYVIGGCTDSGCGSTAVQVYDPSTGSWRMAAAYPEPISYEGCGTITGQIYCAGGSTGTVQGTSHGYVYDPATDSWSAMPSLPIDLWGMAYSGADGQLLVSGGVTGGGTDVTNQGFAYTPDAGWSTLPNSPDAVYRSGSGCGLYEIGGYNLDGTASDATQVLAGYDDCGSGSAVPWLTATPATTTLAPGASTTISVSLSADATTVTQPGAYTASLALVNSTPYKVTGDPVTAALTVTPPGTWGELTGTVTGLACDGTSKPLPGATVEVTGKAGSWALTTGSSGQYSLWASQAQDPLTVIAQASGWQPQTAKAAITAGKTSTGNLTLTPTGGCAASGGRHA
jgi:hypothetical protein